MDFPIDEYFKGNIESEGNGCEDIKYSKEDFLQEVVFLEKTIIN